MVKKVGPIKLDDNQQKLLNQFKIEEGYKPKPYTDTVGKVSIGIGRNLTDVGLSDEEILNLWKNDVIRCESALDAQLSWWRSLDEVRQRVLLDMCFNMGIGTLLTFKTTLANIQQGNWKAAKQGMLASKWAKQVGNRAIRLSSMMETGQDAYSNLR